MIKTYGIIFKDDCKQILINSEEEYDLNNEVIVSVDSLLKYGKIANIYDVKEDVIDTNKIIRNVTIEDTNTYYKNLKDAVEAKDRCNKFIDDLGLNMHVISCSFSFDRSQLLFLFTSDERVDFRELAKKLAAIYHTRIELRQIGARDKAKQVGGIGLCGQKLCCSSFLNEIGSISMSKAKHQNLALNPNKINGSCGRLLCCLCYEDDEYVRCSKGLLSVGSKVKYNNQDAVIKSVDILNRKYKILIDEEKIEVSAEEVENVTKK